MDLWLGDASIFNDATRFNPGDITGGNYGAESYAEVSGIYLKDYSYFLKNNHWQQNCPFVLEWPYLTITDMIKDKLIDEYIDTMLEQAIADE